MPTSSLKPHFLIAAMLFMLSSPVSAQRDVAGASDPQQLNRFPLSWIVSYSQNEVPEYALATGPMKKLEGVIAPEQFDRLSGQLNRITYRIPDNHSPADAFSFYQQQLEALKADILFQCSSRGCGSSNQWANNYFGVKELYGIDRTQFYLSASLGSQKIALYTVKRGNRRIYLHIDLIEPLAQSAASINDDLEQKGFSWLDNTDDIQSLLELLSEDGAIQLLIVGYEQGASGSDFAQLQSSSRQRADEFRNRLIDAGLSGERLEAVGVGPVMPVASPPSQEGIWIQRR
ncbi:MAG: DUF4892 domain-containing protein [Amphritea sp.]|nr:DUF4892 domain-containing protein [Amphritea sp.]